MPCSTVACSCSLECGFSCISTVPESRFSRGESQHECQFMLDPKMYSEAPYGYCDAIAESPEGPRGQIELITQRLSNVTMWRATYSSTLKLLGGGRWGLEVQHKHKLTSLITALLCSAKRKKYEWSNFCRGHVAPLNEPCGELLTQRIRAVADGICPYPHQFVTPTVSPKVSKTQNYIQNVHICPGDASK